MKLVVTIPALNEAKTIAQVVRGVPTDIPGIDETEVIVVNDGSTDETAAIAADAGASVINLPGGGGLGIVFRAGFEQAMVRGADIIVNIDGDGQFSPADIAKLVVPLLEDRADFVTCTRFADPALRPQMPAVKYYGNQIVTRMINVGERSGKLEEVLGYLAEFYDLEVQTAMRNLTSILEPVLLVLIGLVALGLAFAIIIPIYNFIGAISRL